MPRRDCTGRGRRHGALFEHPLLSDSPETVLKNRKTYRSRFLTCHMDAIRKELVKKTTEGAAMGNLLDDKEIVSLIHEMFDEKVPFNK